MILLPNHVFTYLLTPWSMYLLYALNKEHMQGMWFQNIPNKKFQLYRMG